MGPHYRHCFGCGDLHPTGLHLEILAGVDVRVHARFTVTEHHQGAPGLAHGGLLAAAFDEAMGYVLGLIGSPAVTGRLETDYVRPVPVGSTLVIDCECGVSSDARSTCAARVGSTRPTARSPYAPPVCSSWSVSTTSPGTPAPGDIAPTDRSWNP